MAKFRNQIGPLAPIFAVEAAVRHGSFTLAARELGVTQAAVSKQITALEDRLGLPLFRRLHRHVEPTEAGQKLADGAHEALTLLSRTLQDLPAPKPKPLTVSLSTSLSRFWLMQRMPDFRRSHPDLGLRILAEDRPGGEPGDLAIRYAITPPPEPGAIRLFGATVTPMAAPDLLRAHPVGLPRDVPQAPLIHYDTPDRSWIGWGDWQRRLLPQASLPTPALSVSRYDDAVLAAQQGEGLVLIWQVQDGREDHPPGLTPLTALRITAPGAFWVIPQTAARAATQAALRWFARQSHQPP